MSTLGRMIRYAMRDKPKKQGWIRKEKWIEKMKAEGKWKEKK